jgi:hypothetical protein
MGKLSKSQFEKRLAAIEAGIQSSESKDDSDTICWVDENDNPIPISVHFRGMNPKSAQKALNDAVAKYISEYRSLQDFMVRIEAMQHVHWDTTPEQTEQVFNDVRARREAEGRVLSERELKLLASKEMNKYGSYKAYKARPPPPMPVHIRNKIDAVYADT